MPAVSEAIKTEDAAYIAGIVDGEGYIRISRASNRRNTYVGRIGITNCDLQLLTWVLSMFGGNIHSKKCYSSRHSKSYEWAIHRKCDIRFLIEAILPYLRIKRRQAELMLDFLGEPKMQRLKVGNPPGRVLVAPSREIERFEKYAIQSSLLNKRGT